MVVEAGAAGVVETADERGDGVEVSCRHLAGGKRRLQLRHTCAGRPPTGGGTRLAARASAAVREHRLGRLAASDLGQIGAASGHRHVDGVEPAAHPLRQGDDLGQPVAIARGRIERRDAVDHRFDVVRSEHVFSVHMFGLGVKNKSFAYASKAVTTPDSIAREHGLWRSLVHALDWGSRGREFESPQPDEKGQRIGHTEADTTGGCARTGQRLGPTRCMAPIRGES